MRAVLARIERVNPRLNAFVTLTADQAPRRCANGSWGGTSELGRLSRSIHEPTPAPEPGLLPGPVNDDYAQLHRAELGG